MTPERFYIGVDPGIAGALALIGSQRGLLEVVTMPIKPAELAGTIKSVVACDELRLLMRRWVTQLAIRDPLQVVVIMERMLAFSGAVTNLHIGYTAGLIEATLQPITGHPIRRPTPAQWRKLYGLKKATPGGKGLKKDAVSCARDLYGPTIPKVFRHDKAEAVLIAHWAMTTDCDADAGPSDPLDPSSFPQPQAVGG
jgi:hypothetical protein